VARSRGLPVRSIVLFIFGGVSNIEQEPKSPGTEFLMAFVGPLTSLLLGALAYVLALPLRGRGSPVEAVLTYLAVTNVLLGLFNLVPGFPLDGGRVLRSIIWKVTGKPQMATRIATFVGQVFAYLFILWGILLFFNGAILNGLLIIFTGWFLLNAAQTIRMQSTFEEAFRGVTVEQKMNTNMITVPANISLQRLVDEYFLPQGLRSAFVLRGDQLAGLITLSDIRHVARDQWPQTAVGMVMIPLERLHVATPQQNLSDVLPLMNGQDVNQLPVVQDGRLLGVLSRDAILRSLAIQRSLGVSQNQRRAG